MFRILAVDDEIIEIEAMRKLVPWEEADARLVATAADGEEGLMMIRETNPDIVITDIRMPRMDGITMIEKAQESHPGIIFIVLSGYGEYEYTSRAMELGIRHYILKPIDEHKILETLRKAEDEKRSFEMNENERRGKDETIRRLEPSARRSFFIRALKGSATKEETVFYNNRLRMNGSSGILAFMIAGSTGEEAEEEMLDMASGIIGGKMLLSAEIRGVFYFLIQSPELGQLEKDALMIRRYAIAQGFRDIRFAFSDKADLTAARASIEMLLARPWQEGRLIQSDGRISTEENERLLRRDVWKDVRDITGLYRYASSFDLMMAGADYPDQLRKQTISSFTMMTENNLAESGPDRESIFSTIEGVFLRNIKEEAEERRDRMIIRAVFLLLPNPAHMNEDYFSRYFQKITGTRFSRFVTRERMHAAIDMISFTPTIPLTRLAQAVGYQEDGQYFQKVFKETFGITLSAARSRYFPNQN